MKFEDFIASLNDQQVPASLDVYQQTLWYAGKDNWQQAHELIQDIPGKDAALLHAHLHRVEGDQWNADYWYSKAGTRSPGNSLKDEWTALVKQFLK